MKALDALLKGVETRYNKALTLEVLFHEGYTAPQHPKRTESGTLRLRKPGRMRWDYSDPAGKLFLSDGKNLYLYTPNNKRVEKMKLTPDRRSLIYNNFLTLDGIPPEVFDYKTKRIVAGSYHLRPEIVESTYYLYHYTRDATYRWIGEKMFDDFVQYCRADGGYAALADVATKQQRDEMESFALAETFKYFYLLFAPPKTLDFDRVIFNTEAHPMRKSF